MITSGVEAEASKSRDIHSFWGLTSVAAPKAWLVINRKKRREKSLEGIWDVSESGECRLLVWCPALIDVGALIRMTLWNTVEDSVFHCCRCRTLLNTAISVIHLIQGHVRDCLGFKRPLAGIGAQRCTRTESRRRSDVSQQSDSYLNWRIWSQLKDREKFAWFCYTIEWNSKFDLPHSDHSGLCVLKLLRIFFYFNNLLHGARGQTVAST